MQLSTALLFVPHVTLLRQSGPVVQKKHSTKQMGTEKELWRCFALEMQPLMLLSVSVALLSPNLSVLKSYKILIIRYFPLTLQFCVYVFASYSFNLDEIGNLAVFAYFCILMLVFFLSMFPFHYIHSVKSI